MTPNRMLRTTLCLLAFLPAGAGAQQDKPADTGFGDFQKDFAAAYNRGDLDAMAAAFAANAIRVTPSGIFQGRDAIRRGFQDALKLGLHDYSVRQVVSRSRFLCVQRRRVAGEGGRSRLPWLLHRGPRSRGRPNQDHGRDGYGGSPLGRGGGHQRNSDASLSRGERSLTREVKADGSIPPAF